MSADIEKLAVLDSRIVQSRPKYAVEKGALSLTNAPFSAIAATSSQHTYNIYVPSENVFVDREIRWSSTCFMKFNVAVSGVGSSAGDSVVVPGRDFSLTAMPLNSLCSTLSATINDTTSVINSQDVLKEVLRLTDYKKNRLVRTAPTALDKYQLYDDAYGTLNNPIGGYDGSKDYDNTPNGAHGQLSFTAPDGTRLAGTALEPVAGKGTPPAFTGAAYGQLNGMPVLPVAWSPLNTYNVAGNLVWYADNVYVSDGTPLIGVARYLLSNSTYGFLTILERSFSQRTTDSTISSIFTNVRN